MEGLVEPSMPTLPSAINAMKDATAATPPTTAADKDMDRQPKKLSYLVDNDKRKSSFDDKEFAAVAEAKQLNFRKSAFKYGKEDDATKAKTAAKKTVGKMLLTARQKSDIAEAFNAFDVTGTGFMDLVDLRVALKALGFTARMEEMHKLFGEYDTGNTGRLCYHDFLSIIERKLGETDTKEDLLKTFKLFDKDDAGRISFQNLRDVVDELEEDLNDEEVLEMIAEADLDETGTITEDEFLKILKKEKLY